MHVENEQAQLEAIAAGRTEGSDGVHNSGALPSDSPYYNRLFWASYKGQSRGVWGGILLGCLLGAAGGVVLAGALAAIGGVGITAALVAPMVGIGSMVGMLYGKEVFGLSGAVAGAVAAGMEISEERRHAEEQARGVGVGTGDLAPVNSALGMMSDHTKVSKMASGELPYSGDEDSFFFGKKHHEFGDRPSFFGDVAISGALIGALFGAVMSYVGGGMLGSLEHVDAFSKLVGSGGPLAGISATAAGVAVTGGCSLVGATYGINRHYFRNLFNVSNDLYDGKVVELGKENVKKMVVLPAQVVGGVTARAVPEVHFMPDSGSMLGGHQSVGVVKAASLATPLSVMPVAVKAGAVMDAATLTTAAAAGGLAVVNAHDTASESSVAESRVAIETPKMQVNNVVMAERQQSVNEHAHMQQGA